MLAFVATEAQQSPHSDLTRRCSEWCGGERLIAAVSLPQSQPSVFEAEVCGFDRHVQNSSAAYRNIGSDNFEVRLADPNFTGSAEQNSKENAGRIFRNVEHDIALLPICNEFGFDVVCEKLEPQKAQRKAAEVAEILNELCGRSSRSQR